MWLGVGMAWGDSCWRSARDLQLHFVMTVSRRGIAVLWMLCPVVAHLAGRGLLFHTVYFHFEPVTDSVLCVF